MAKVPANTFLLLSRRAYTAGAENVAERAAAKKAAAAEGSSREAPPATAGEKDEVFWMRDPKTGNWIPETHFNDVNVAELREKLLPNDNNNNKK